MNLDQVSPHIDAITQNAGTLLVIFPLYLSINVTYLISARAYTSFKTCQFCDVNVFGIVNVMHHLFKNSSGITTIFHLIHFIVLE